MMATVQESKNKKKHKKSRTSGDDLEDNLEFIEQVQPDDGSDKDDTAESPAISQSEKRSASQQPDEERNSKKKQKFETLKAKKKETKGARDVDIRYRTSVEQANHLWLKFLDTQQKDLSSLEAKQQLSQEHFAAFATDDENRTQSQLADALRQLPESDAIFKLTPEQESAEETGAPAILVVSPSAESAADLAESLHRGFQRRGVARLYGRRVKIDSHIAFLKSPVRFAVGTPHRLHKLADAGALSVGQLKYLVVDMSRNVKQLSILDMPDTKHDWNNFFKTYCLERIKTGQTKIVLY